MKKKLMLSVSVVVLALIMIIGVSAAVYSGSCGYPLKYKLNTETKTLTISGKGKIENYATAGNVSPWFSRRQYVNTVVIEDGVTNISKYAFYKCTEMTSITIPRTVVDINSTAFYKCSEFTIKGYIGSYAETYANDNQIGFETIYAVKYDANGGTGVLSAQIKTNGEDLILSDIIPTKEGYAFKGWATSSTANSATYQPGDIYSIDSDVTLYAIWQTAIYNITYDVNGGNGILATQTKTHNEDLILHTTIPTRTGYTFAGWATSSTASSATYQPGQTYLSNGDITLYAVWKIATYNVTYNANGGSGAPSVQTKTYGVNLYLSLAIPQRDNYTFVGWSTSSTAKTAEYLSGAVYSMDENTTLYAVWKAELLYSGKCGNNITWELFSDGLLSITGYGDMTNWTHSSNAPWATYKSNIKEVVIENGITSIGNYAFYFTDLTSITIPDSITSIGDCSFYSCDGLKEINIPKNVTTIKDKAFYGCSNLLSINVDINNKNYSSLDGVLFNKEKTKLICYPNGKSETTYTIPDGVISIGYEAFLFCRNLTSINIPDSVTNIGEDVFSWCTNLKSINVNINNSCYSSLTGVLFNKDKTELICYPRGKNETSYTIPDSVTNIGDSAFSGCDSLTSITIPDSVTTIGSRAFYSTEYYNDNNNWENDVLYIGNYLIEAKDTITGSYTVKNGTKCIAGSAFWSCDSLTTITFPESLISIGENAFLSCDGLISVYITDMAFWCGIEFFGCWSNPLYHAENLYLDENLVTELIIPNSVTSIGDYAFYYCKSLASVTIPNSITSVGKSAFYGCSNVTAVNITDLASWCSIDFYDYDSNPLYYAGKLYLNENLITKLTIPESVTNIKNYVFCGCDDLTLVTILDNVMSIGDNAFRNCYGFKICGVAGSVAEIYAKNNSISFIPFYYDITYDANGGDKAPKSQIKTYSINLELTSDIPIRDGYSFAGWATSSTGTPNYMPGDIYTSNQSRTLYAVWKKIFNISYDANGGKGAPYAQSKIEGQELTLSSTIPTRIGYTFRCWSIDSSGMLAQVQIPVEGIESSHNYANSTSETWTIAHAGADSIVLKFDSRTSFESNCDYLYIYDNNGDLVGKYTGTTLSNNTVEIQGDLVQLKLTSDSSTTKWGFKVTSAIANTGYAPGAVYTLNSDATLYAVWDIITYSVTYNANGGSSVPSTQTKEYGADITISDKIPSRTDHEFLGWSTSADGEIEYLPGDDYLDNSDITLYALWRKYYTVNYYGNGGTIEVSSQLKYEDSDLTISEVVPQRQGYNFLGYSTSASGSVEYMPGDILTENKNVELWAKWSPHEYIVTYDANGGTGAPASQVKYHDSSLRLSSVIPTHSIYYVFGGWSTSPYGKANYSSGGWYYGNSDVTLYAVWNNLSGKCGNTINWTLYPDGELRITGTGKMNDWILENYVPWYDIREIITKVVISDGITAVNKNSFKGCISLTDVVLGKDISIIEERAFYGCSSLKSVDIPENVVNIKDYAFYGCSSLDDITLGDNIKSIAQYAFSNCTSLKEFILPTGITSIGDYAFKECSQLESIIIPNNVTTIGASAFYKCEKLKNAIIGTSVTSIGDYAFAFCSALERVVITDNVTSIGEKAFTWDTLLTIYGISESYAHSYAIDNNIKFVASLQKYSVLYDANGGSNSPEKQEKYTDIDIKLSDTIPVKENCEFIGWAISNEATEVSYMPGSVFTKNADTTLYAVWNESKVTNTTATKYPSYTICNVNLYGIPQSSVLWIAGYKDSRLVHNEKRTVTTDTESFAIIGDIDEVKVFVFEDTISMKPLTECETINLN